MAQFHLPEYKPTHTLSDFEFLHDPKDRRSKLGLGSFATVKLAREKKSGKLFALKLIDIHPSKVTKSDIDNLKSEILIHRDLDHPHVIKFHGYMHHENFVYLILDYAENGNLYSYHHRKKRLTEKEIFQFFHQTCLAISYLHDNDVIHRDIKPENLLLDKDFNIKICDFGWSALDISQERKTFCGTYEYMAPEIVHKKTYDHRVDIWAIGILLYELIHNRAPFRGRTMQEIKSSLTGGDITFNSDIAADAKNLIQKILTNDPKHRMVISDILADPWVTNHLEREDAVRKSVYQDEPQQDLTKQQKLKIFDNSKEEPKKKSINILTDSVQKQFFSLPGTQLKKTVSVTTTTSTTTTNRPSGVSPFNLDKGIITNLGHEIRGEKQSPKSAVLSATHIFEDPKTPPKQGNNKRIFDNTLLSPSFNDRFNRAIINLNGNKKSSFAITTKAKSENVPFPLTFRVPKPASLLGPDSTINNQENTSKSHRRVISKGVPSLGVDENVPKSLGARNLENLDIASLKNTANIRLGNTQESLSKTGENQRFDGENTLGEPKKLMSKLIEDFKFVKNLLVGPAKSGSSSDKENAIESKIGKRNL